ARGAGHGGRAAPGARLGGGGGPAPPPPPPPARLACVDGDPALLEQRDPAARAPAPPGERGQVPDRPARAGEPRRRQGDGQVELGPRAQPGVAGDRLQDPDGPPPPPPPPAGPRRAQRPHPPRRPPAAPPP